MDAIFNRRPPTAWDRFKSSPLLFLARLIYVPSHTPPNFGAGHTDKVRVICISDTHNSHNSQPPLPDGDILIHSGDLTQSGTQQELENVLSWLNSQPHSHKLFIAGNHDTCLADSETHRRISSTYPGLTYLQDSSTEIVVRGRRLRIYGSPYTPKHGSWVFQYPRVHPLWYSPDKNLTSEYQSTKLWSCIPPLTDILITHGPPFAHLDLDDRVGCYALLTALWRVRPRLHVFGHIHAGRGLEFVMWDRAQKAYEDVCAGRSGWGGLIRLIWWTVTACVWQRNREDGTVLVNAAAVGGFRDDQRKGAIVVEL
ncbi:metallophosphoesterase domain-containing protein 1 [Dendrothele bispora CBS 962.96]|uniref:Metallophosphoesterase domain-containing protein 1 n=1 Tax=Dendrothele bispora (strain CBS 962.96) TaxID=1314807 RepID=A0A4S8MFS5_DENBC|nr:metallophosphoesterase domain-containing protein 1 [Dendrothele bispora CBS 962.96]